MARCRSRGLFDNIFGAEQGRGRYRNAERFGGLEVEDGLDACGLLHGQVGGLFAFENAAEVPATR